MIEVELLPDCWNGCSTNLLGIGVVLLFAISIFCIGWIIGHSSKEA